MKKPKGFVLITVLIIIFVLSTLGISHLFLSTSRVGEIAGYAAELQLVYLAESGIGRAQSMAVGDAFLSLNGQQYSLGNGTYEIIGSFDGIIRTVTVNSYIPNKQNKEYSRTIAISGPSITSNYSWIE